MSAQSLLNNPLESAYYNKGTAFTNDERHAFFLHGLLPKTVQRLDDQVARAYEQYCSCPNELSKNVFMTSMADQNTVLFYALLMSHLKEMFPVVYTPTEGDAIMQYSHLFRRPHGCFLDIDDLDDVEVKLRNASRGKDVRYIVVSDGEAILGLGDQGVGVIMISAAKLVIATACGGLDPRFALPVVLDTGTNNQDILNDPLYLGSKHERRRGSSYDALVDKFVMTARKLFPDVYIHFEDFGVTNARNILDRHRDQISCFNDDIQGTGCVVMAAILTGLVINNTALKETRFLVFGSGSAGCGIAEQVANSIAVDCQCDVETARRQITCVDKSGVLTEENGEELSVAQRPFARPKGEWTGKNATDLASIIGEVRPHVLIGTSTRPGSFTQKVVQEMAKHVERPIILPLSNPTRLHEAKPADLIEWTQGRALVATGSPFEPVDYNGKSYEIGECNNSCCFPGIGLGCVLSQATRLTNEMLLAAVKAMATDAPALKDPTKGLVPDVTDARRVSVSIAVAIIQKAKKLHLCREPEVPDADDDIQAWVKKQMWQPVYKEYKG